MTATMGRLRPCPLLDLRFVVLSHNTVRGAAGAAIQNAELLVAHRRGEAMIVCKFGGTSVGTADAIGRLVEIVRSRQAERPLVVVSALSGLTDALLRIGSRLAEADGDAVDAHVHELVARHERTAAELGLSADAVGPIGAEATLFRQWLGERIGRTLGPADRDELRPPGRALELVARDRRAPGRAACRPSGWT